MLAIKRHGVDPAERLVVEVGQPGVDLQIFELRQHLDRGARQDRELHVGMAHAERGGEACHHRERGGDGGDAQPPGQAVTQRLELLPHGAGVAHDAPCPVEHPLALRGEALEAGPAVDQQHAHGFLELLDPGGQRGLGHAAGLGRAAEMPLARQRQKEFQLIDQCR